MELCNHLFFHSKSKSSLNFCKLCGIMRYENVKILNDQLDGNAQTNRIQLYMRI
jgi:hypothetical protein